MNCSLQLTFTKQNNKTISAFTAHKHLRKTCAENWAGRVGSDCLASKQQLRCNHTSPRITRRSTGYEEFAGFRRAPHTDNASEVRIIQCAIIQHPTINRYLIQVTRFYCGLDTTGAKQQVQDYIIVRFLWEDLPSLSQEKRRRDRFLIVTLAPLFSFLLDPLLGMHPIFLSLLVRYSMQSLTPMLCQKLHRYSVLVYFFRRS